MARISVIIPSRNRAPMLRRAIESARAAGKGVEIVVVDDASTDETESMCAAFTDITYIRMRRNVGPARARNAGIRSSKAEYLAFLDDDDIRLRDTLARQVEMLDRDERIGFVYGQVLIGDPQTCIPTGEIRPGHCPTGSIFMDLIGGNFIYIASVVVRRRLFEDIGLFAHGARPTEDWDAWLRLAAISDVGAIAEPVAIYRNFARGSDQLSANLSQMWRSSARTQAKALRSPAASTIARESRQEVRAQFMKAVWDQMTAEGSRSFQERKLYRAAVSYVVAVQLCPEMAISACSWLLTFGRVRALAEYAARKTGKRSRRNHTAAARLKEAVLLMQAGNLTMAETTVRQVADRQSDDFVVLNLLGVLCKRRGRLEEAVASFARAVAAAPDRHAPWFNLGNTLLDMGAPARALAPMEHAAVLSPYDSETQRLLGRALAGAGRHDRAMQAFARAEALDPANSRVHRSRMAELRRIGAPDAEILAELDRLISLEPETIEHLRDKALLLQQRFRFAEAEAVHRAILERNPEDFETLLRLGHMLGYLLRRYAEANDCLRRALALRPHDARCLAALCKSLLDGRLGEEVGADIDEANGIARRVLVASADLLPYVADLISVFLQTADFAALARLPDRSRLMPYWISQMDVGSLHLLLGRVLTSEDRHELVRWHRQWGRLAIAQAQRAPVERRPPRAPRPKIRLGFMSSDLRNHPVAYFTLPFFQHYDRSRFEIICYTFYPAPPDQIQQFVQQQVVVMHHLPEVSDGEVAQRIADDDLDILFELGGSTRYNRLPVMAYRAAPVQASWLGYPHSAGLETIDYIVMDPYLKPPDSSLLIEKPLLMPESWVTLSSLGFYEEPIEDGLPEERQGRLTFGTMNNPYKYTPELFALWAEVMRRVEGSCFLFARTEAAAPCFRENIAREFETLGIRRQRIEFIPVRGPHLHHYNRIDIALDTAPHTGGTTTCETLWMGVPVVTLVGDAFFERLSYSNLSNAGLGDLCAVSPEEYVEIVVGLAGDRVRRRDLRRNLRPYLRRTPLGDSVRWVNNFETAIQSTLR